MGKLLSYTVEKSCFIEGEHKEVGDVVTLDEQEGNYLVSIGRLSKGDNSKAVKKDKKDKTTQPDGDKS